jgi:hypothetical protein
MRKHPKKQHTKFNERGELKREKHAKKQHTAYREQKKSGQQKGRVGTGKSQKESAIY